MKVFNTRSNSLWMEAKNSIKDVESVKKDHEMLGGVTVCQVITRD